MYGARELSGKIVSMRAPVQAQAGLDDVRGELEIGDLAACGNLPTGAPCRGFEGGGVLGRCVCVNLSDAETSAEVKQLVATAAGRPMSKSVVWTFADQEVLAGWAEEYSGVYLPDLRRPWRSGYVSVSDLLQRTAPGDAYPTGHALWALLDAAGCEPPDCPAYDRLSDAVAQVREGAGALDEVSALSVYPPRFGETSGNDTIEPGEAPPTGDELHVDLEKRPGPWLGWGAAAVAVAALVWWQVRRA